MTNFTFTKNERLKSRKVIASMFKNGKSFGQYPLRLIWVEVERDDLEYPVQFTVSVPKKKFSKAVHRNQIRRLIKEAYRLNKHKLYKKLADNDKHYAWMILYVAKEPTPYQEIESCMKKIIHRFPKMLKKL